MDLLALSLPSRDPRKGAPDDGLLRWAIDSEINQASEATLRAVLEAVRLRFALEVLSALDLDEPVRAVVDLALGRRGGAT